MARLFALMALLGSLAGCVDTVGGGKVVTNYVDTNHGTTITIDMRTRDRNRPLRGEMVFSCSSINGLRAYLDYAERDRSCTYRYMTAARKIDWYDSNQFGWVDVYEFMEDGWYYYAFVKGGGYRGHHYRRHY